MLTYFLYNTKGKKKKITWQATLWIQNSFMYSNIEIIEFYLFNKTCIKESPASASVVGRMLFSPENQSRIIEHDVISDSHFHFLLLYMSVFLESQEELRCQLTRGIVDKMCFGKKNRTQMYKGMWRDTGHNLHMNPLESSLFRNLYLFLRCMKQQTLCSMHVKLSYSNLQFSIAFLLMLWSQSVMIIEQKAHTKLLDTIPFFKWTFREISKVVFWFLFLKLYKVK